MKMQYQGYQSNFPVSFRSHGPTGPGHASQVIFIGELYSSVIATATNPLGAIDHTSYTHQVCFFSSCQLFGYDKADRALNIASTALHHSISSA
jgi:hypothetical protein